MPPFVLARSLSLGTTAYVSVRDIPISEASDLRRFEQIALQVLKTADIEVGAQILPHRSARLAFSRSFTPVSGAQSLWLRIQTTFNHLPFHLPPIVNITVSRPLGEYRRGYCSWNSGSTFWPRNIRALLEPIKALSGSTDESRVAILQPSSFSLGLNGVSIPTKTKGDVEAQSTDESWGIDVTASPGGGALSFNYSRDVFGRNASASKLSEWSSEGRHKDLSEVRSNYEVKAVRLEVQTSLNAGGSLLWSVRGTRVFGDFTRAGVGIGIQGARGLVVSLTWTRLGQNITVPVAVCPLDLADANLAAAVVAIPWLAYTCLYFGMLKPRARRLLREAKGRKQLELEKLASRRKAESKKVIALMKSTVQHRQEKEARTGGLVILDARYGPKSDRHQNGMSSESIPTAFIDVTIPVAALVHHGQLTIPKSLDKVIFHWLFLPMTC